MNVQKVPAEFTPAKTQDTCKQRDPEISQHSIKHSVTGEKTACQKCDTAS